MRIAVCDSSTLILLAKISLVKKVYDYYDKVLITKEVFRETVELGKIKNKEDALIIEREVRENRINISEVKDKSNIKEILKNFKCNLGEAEALSLAIEKNIKIFTDDLEAIKICKIYNTEFITALAFLIKLVHDNKIEKEDALIKFDTISKIGFYSKEILNYALEECNKKWSK